MRTIRVGPTLSVTTPVLFAFDREVVAAALRCEHVWQPLRDIPVRVYDADHSNCTLAMQVCGECGVARRSVLEGPREELDDIFGPWQEPKEPQEP
jgi:hypothetical protein